MRDGLALALAHQQKEIVQTYILKNRSNLDQCDLVTAK